MGIIKKLQQQLKDQNLDFYWIEDADPHFNEYVTTQWARRSWVSGFDGSNGVLLVGRERAYLWTDGRYFIQAKQQLQGTSIEMCPWVMPEQTPLTFLQDQVKASLGKLSLGFDPSTVSINWYNNISEIIPDLELVSLENNLVDNFRYNLEDKLRDNIKSNSKNIFCYDIKYSGQSCADKLSVLSDFMQQESCNYLVLSNSEQIAWLLNLRGSDILYNPVFLSYCIIRVNTNYLDNNKLENKLEIELFVDLSKVDNKVKDYCQSNNIKLLEYELFNNKLEGLVLINNINICLDPGKNSYNVLLGLEKSKLKFLKKSDLKADLKFNIKYQTIPIDKFKAVKNKLQQQNMIKAHVLDSVALIKGIYNLEHNWASLNEYSAAGVINSARLENNSCKDLSFETISSIGPNSAVIHYAPAKDSSLPLSDTQLYLLDSGGQYLEGTTDVTRCLYFGEVKAKDLSNNLSNNLSKNLSNNLSKNLFKQEQYLTKVRKFYTLVLKGNLALSRVSFPKGTTGQQLDSLARQFLWEQGVDYSHGTGHGVGNYLCVHEGPQSISPRASSSIVLEEGMVVSNEPGVYFEGEFGIRIEDLLLVVSCVKNPNFLSFQKLTLFPYEVKLLDENLLSSQDITDINNYHDYIEKAILIDLDKELDKELDNKYKKWFKKYKLLKIKN